MPVLLLVASALLAAAVAARGEVSREGAVTVTVTGRISPSKLPRSGAAPVSVSVGGRIDTTDRSAPPQLRTLRIELNRHGHLDYAGLPVCPYDRIQPASSARALAACRSSLVGRGTFSADVVLSGQEPYPSQGRLLVFNGRQRGRPVLLGQIYSPRPFANSFVIVFVVRHLARGRFGTVLTAQLPKALGSWGYLTAIDLKLGRRYRHAGARHSFVSAACPAPEGFPGATFQLARTSFDFASGPRLESTLVRSCRVG